MPVYDFEDICNGDGSATPLKDRVCNKKSTEQARLQGSSIQPDPCVVRIRQKIATPKISGPHDICQ